MSDHHHKAKRANELFLPPIVEQILSKIPGIEESQKLFAETLVVGWAKFELDGGTEEHVPARRAKAELKKIRDAADALGEALMALNERTRHDLQIAAGRGRPEPQDNSESEADLLRMAHLGSDRIETAEAWIGHLRHWSSLALEQAAGNPGRRPETSRIFAAIGLAAIFRELTGKLPTIINKSSDIYGNEAGTCGSFLEFVKAAMLPIFGDEPVSHVARRARDWAARAKSSDFDRIINAISELR
jgi:hypothetical protein